MKETLLVLLMIMQLFSFVTGIAHGLTSRTGCTYDSIATKFNPSYRVACFLVEPRFREEK